MKVALALSLALLSAPAALASPLPGAPRCPIFPRDNAWNQRVDRLPVAPDSARSVASIGLQQGLHPDFGSGRYEGRPIGIPYDVVSNRKKRSRVRFEYALRFTVSQTRRAFTAPARHFASSLTDPALPRMGERLRLRADYPVRNLPRQARIVAQALQRYGMLVADNGSDWYLSGAPNPAWNNHALHELGRIRGADVEVVRTG